MKAQLSSNLKEALKDSHDHFFLLKGVDVVRLRVWEIREDSLIIDMPEDISLHRTLLGFIPMLDGSGIYRLSGNVDTEALPEQKPHTVRLKVDPATITKMNRRRYQRVNFIPPLQAKVTPELEGHRTIDARIVSLSPGGIRVETDEELPGGKLLIFQFEIHCDNTVHKLSHAGNVLYELPLGTGHAYGVEFVWRRSSDPEAHDEKLMEIFRKLLLSR